ncbi:hypothetical protein JOC78_002273 [Bacillus ectoiniformans]|uniref:S8 family peptidase n=1 Tax=Bacillus ectoiniformans TaxID=1494429 RepID=UPI0019590A43|nr:S8 family serine peptidase [Bacillus ectoiniformans]MBM7649320.1 hypothetical protein [Bacillus ectoiniformans]
MKRYSIILSISVFILLLPFHSYTKAAVNDPLYSGQTSLQTVQFPAMWKHYNKPSTNLFMQKTFQTSSSSFTYTGQSFSASSFTVQTGDTRLSRLSVEIDNKQISWTLRAQDENGKELASTTGTSSRLDVLLPKSTPLSSITLSLSAEGHPFSPRIQKVTGVQHARIAVIDSGIAPHEDFCDNVLLSLGQNFIEGELSPLDQYGHGIHVTGILAACPDNGKGVTGVLGHAPVDIIPMKALNKFGLGGDQEMAKAIEAALLMDADVINISIAGKGHHFMLDGALKKAYLKGVPVIAAAGNSNESTATVSPASFPYVITVASLTPDLKKAASSNFGWEVDLAAPGESVLSTHTGNGYERMGGTSMAAPFVTGAAALLKIRQPHISQVELKSLLTKSTNDVLAKGYDMQSGYGLINFQKLLDVEKKPDLMEWLTLKNKQPLTMKNHWLAVSSALTESNIHLFVNDKKIAVLPIKQALIPIQLESKKTRPAERITAVAVSGSSIKEVHTLMAVNPEGQKAGFKDIPSSFWGYEDITAASLEGYIYGYGDGTYRPNQPISRKHTAMILGRLIPFQAPPELHSPFTDVKAEMNAPELAILSAHHSGIIKGVGSKFFPERTLTRGQAALLFHRALSKEVHLPTGVYSFHDVKREDEIYLAVQQLAEAGIINKQVYFNPSNPLTRGQLAAMMMRAHRLLFTSTSK